MRLKINGRVYPEPALDGVSLRDLLVFDAEVRDLSPNLRWTWADVERVSEEFAALAAAGKDADGEKHPDRYMYMATLIWVARRAEGDVVTFGEAVDVPLSKFEWLPDPADRKKKAGPTKGAKKPPKVSAAVDAPVEPGESTTPQTSESPSTPE